MSEVEDKLAMLLLRWEECWEHGEDISLSQLCADCPDLMEPLRAKIDVLKKMAWMKDVDSEPSDTTDATDPLLGKTFAGRYKIEALIAEGGFGRVYRAFDPDLQRPVAVKVPKHPRGNLLEEARKVAKLRHPGIVSVHDVGQDDGIFFIVTDLIEGTNLADLIAGNRPKAVDAARMVADIADALAFAHQEGFIHRDIKPANILIDKQGEALITDFGIAATAEELTFEQHSSGTLPYMAPEQLAGETQLIDGRTDVYALGVVLYEMLTGHKPHNARTPTALREQILFRSPLPIDRSVPARIQKICLRCLSKHPADRFPTVLALAEALRKAIAKQARIRHWRIPLIALVLIVLTVGIFFASSLLLKGMSSAKDRTLEFDGTNRILTPLERFAPVTLEAWVYPKRYELRNHTVIGSDLVTKYGISLGMYSVLLGCEYIQGDYRSPQIVPIREWSHIAGVFAEDETRLYYNGKLVGTGPPTKIKGGTHFVIGNVGEDNPIDFFIGQIRAVRISKGTRYVDDFTPEKEFVKDADAVLIYDGKSLEGSRVIDLSGTGNDGTMTPSFGK